MLIEVHNRAELDRALKLRSRMIGVNNRNLKTLTTDLATTVELAAALPAGRLAVSESGLRTPADLARMAVSGARCFLVGESLLRHQDVAAATRAPAGRGVTGFNHFRPEGKAIMVDVSGKPETDRLATPPAAASPCSRQRWR